MKSLAALYVDPTGPYSGIPFIDLWDKKRDARLYRGPYPVIAHPPCERWGRYWGGGPSAKVKRKLGDDEGCFRWALKAVRRCGGLIEHPEGSHAWKAFNLPRPTWHDGWTEPDEFGGQSCCVAQGHYGHRARKMTWIYGIDIYFKDLIWGPSKPGVRLDLGYHSKEERARAVKTGVCQRLSKRQRTLTPPLFRDLLIEMVTVGADQ